MAKHKSSPHKKKNCLILNWRFLPEPIRTKIEGWDRFGSGLLRINSVFKPRDITEDSIRKHYEKHARNFQGTFEEFVEENGLYMEMWLISEGFDLSNVDEVLVKVGW